MLMMRYVSTYYRGGASTSKSTCSIRGAVSFHWEAEEEDCSGVSRGHRLMHMYILSDAYAAHSFGSWVPHGKGSWLYIGCEEKSW